MNHIIDCFAYMFFGICLMNSGYYMSRVQDNHQEIIDKSRACVLAAVILSIAFFWIGVK